MFYPEKKRKPFPVSVKKTEWMLSAGKNPFTDKFVITSKCRECKIALKWGDRRYDFDHKDNDPLNNSQKNCYLVCKNCHGHATKIDKRKVNGLFTTHKTIKRKIGYKKPKKDTSKKTKRVPIRNPFGLIIGHKNVRINNTKRKKTPRKNNK